VLHDHVSRCGVTHHTTLSLVHTYHHLQTTHVCIAHALNMNVADVSMLCFNDNAHEMMVHMFMSCSYDAQMQGKHLGCYTLLHPTSVERKVVSHVLTAPSPPTSPTHKSLARRPYFSAPFGSKVTALDMLLHQILYSFVLLSRALCSFTSNLATIILLDL
jgi:hypothetical protein